MHGRIHQTMQGQAWRVVCLQQGRPQAPVHTGVQRSQLQQSLGFGRRTGAAAGWGRRRSAGRLHASWGGAVREQGAAGGEEEVEEEEEEGGIGDFPKERKGLSDEDAIRVMGMGTWRLRGAVDPPFEQVVAHVEGAVRHCIKPADIVIKSPPKVYSIMDSLDPGSKEHGGLSWTILPDPEGKGAPGYPRLLVENRCYASRVFRKIHLEVAYRQDGLQVFHCVMYPRLQYDFPILAMDMVGSGDGRVSLAIIDACPVSPDRSLPPLYAQAVKGLQDRFGVSTNRSTPGWAEAIFSPLCISMRPSSSDDVSTFVRYAAALTRTHFELARLVQPVSGQGSATRLAHIEAAHRQFCEQQLVNDKTRRVLSSAFGEEMATEYMSGFMFDFPPQDWAAEKVVQNVGGEEAERTAEE